MIPPHISKATTQTHQDGQTIVCTPLSLRKCRLPGTL